MRKLLKDVTAAHGVRHDDNIRPLHWQCAHCHCNIPSKTAAQMAHNGCLCDACVTSQLLPNRNKKIIIPGFQPQFQYLALARLIAIMDDPANSNDILSDVGLANTADGNRVLVDSEQIKTFFQTLDPPPIILLFWDAAWSHYVTSSLQPVSSGHSVDNLAEAISPQPLTRQSDGSIHSLKDNTEVHVCPKKEDGLIQVFMDTMSSAVNAEERNQIMGHLNRLDCHSPHPQTSLMLREIYIAERKGYVALMAKNQAIVEVEIRKKELEDRVTLKQKELDQQATFKQKELDLQAEAVAVQKAELEFKNKELQFKQQQQEQSSKKKRKDHPVGETPDGGDAAPSKKPKIELTVNSFLTDPVYTITTYYGLSSVCHLLLEVVKKRIIDIVEEPTLLQHHTINESRMLRAMYQIQLDWKMDDEDRKHFALRHRKVHDTDRPSATVLYGTFRSTDDILFQLLRSVCTFFIVTSLSFYGFFSTA
jgi:hypothetical protein